MKHIIKSGNLAWFNSWCLQFLNEYKVKIDDQGWHVNQTEIAKIGLVFATLGDVKVEESATLELGIDSEKMSNFLKDVGDCELTVTYVEGKLVFETEDLVRKMSTTDVSQFATARMPKLDELIKANFQIELAKLKKAIKSAKRLTDYAEFSCEDGYFLVIAKEEMTGDELILKKKVETPVEDCKSLLNLQYLESAAKLMAGEKVNIQLGEKCPIILADKLTEKSSVKFFLAPRIEEED